LIGRQSCASCHQSQFDAFQGSHHDQAMAVATDESVLADFNDQTIEHFGVTSRMFRDGTRFMINTEGPDGQMQDFEVKYTFGVEPLQQYMVELERPVDAAKNEIGKVQVLRVSWDTEQKKWFYLSPPDVSEKLDPSDPLHWTGITQNWNTTCAICHSTDYQKNFDLASRSYHSTFSEIDVSCEACHGPASYHVELAERTSLFWDRNHGYGLAKLKTESNLAQIHTCAPCHSRRAEVNGGFSPGCNFDEFFVLQTINEPVYHPDGQIRDEDYVHGSFIQSKMFHNGIKCSDCHDVHSTKLIYSPSHHHHAPGTPGSQCVDCHMPQTTYMAVDHRRDHSFRVPDPALSIATGTPNACTGCHLDESKLAGHQAKIPLLQYKDWVEAEKLGDEVVAAELKRVNDQMLLAVKSWYSDESKERTTYYHDLAIGLASNSDNAETVKAAQEGLLALAKDARSPAMVRASALTGITDASVLLKAHDTAVELLQDDDLKLVAASLELLDRELGVAMATPTADEISFVQLVDPIVTPVLKQLDHPTSRIRMRAVRVLLNVPPPVLDKLTDGLQRKQFGNAIQESQESLMLNNDQGMSHAVLGSLSEQIGNFGEAEKNYRNAIQVDPNIAGARRNLAVLLTRKMQVVPTAAERDQIAAEIKELRKQEHELLKVDVERAKNIANAHALHYDYAMSAYIQEDFDETKKHLAIALAQQPDDQQYLQAMALFLAKIKEFKEANAIIDRLLIMDPDNVGYRQMKLEALRNLKNE